MTGTLIFERLSNQKNVFLLPDIHGIYGKSYYKFYQLKLRQLLTEKQHRTEQNGPPVKLKPPKDMTQIRDKTRHDLQSKRSNSVLAVSQRRTKEFVAFTITSTNISTSSTLLSAESKPSKSNSKVKPSPTPRPAKVPRITSAPTDSQKSIPKKTPFEIPTIEIDDADDDLPKSNANSYTQVSSSSAHQYTLAHHQHERRAILNAVMVHLHSYTPSDISKWSLYRDIDEKFSASLSPKVYRTFERIIL